MASYLRPRRGKKATAVAQLTASAPLKRGEIFFEVPDTGVGTGKGKIKMGDGTTAYASLPYFMEQPTVDYTNAVVGWTNTTAADSSPYTTNATYVSNIIPSASLKTIFTNLKKLLLNYNSQLTTLNNDLDSFQNGVDTIYNGCKTYGTTPTASTPTAIVNAIKTIYNNRYNAGVSATKKGTAVAGDVLSGKTFTNSSSVNIAGGMTNRGAWTNTPTSSGKVTIPKGYHNGNGYVDTSKVYTAGQTSFYADIPNNIFKSKYINLVRVGLDIGNEISSAYKYSSSYIRLNMNKISSIKINSVQICNAYATVYSVALLNSPATSYDDVYNNKVGTYTDTTTATNWFTVNVNINIDCTNLSGYKYLCAASNSNNVNYKNTFVQITSMSITFV